LPIGGKTFGWSGGLDDGTIAPLTKTKEEKEINFIFIEK